ncbi:hypothetical protein KHA80_21740 [Anaerobacillus sp. HL2]|nr:hypothetical protein KHA80_21740 [Anaerobacillus sp. HL2]
MYMILLIYEVLVEKGWKEETGIEVEVVPGISAINSCASLLGAINYARRL